MLLSDGGHKVPAGRNYGGRDEDTDGSEDEARLW